MNRPNHKLFQRKARYVMSKIPKRLLLAISMCCLVATAHAAPIDDAGAAIDRGDYAQAFKIYRTLAVQGDVTAQGLLGLLYEQGQGVTRDYKEAMKWFRLAAAQGYAAAQSGIGNHYQFGWGVIQDYQEALKWYRLAAAQGLARGQVLLGLMYYKGKGVTQDFVPAHMWVNIAGREGDADIIKMRDSIASQMTSQQIEKAQDMARKCQARSFKGC